MEVEEVIREKEREKCGGISGRRKRGNKGDGKRQWEEGNELQMKRRRQRGFKEGRKARKYMRKL